MSGPIPVGPDDAVGSPALAAALRSGDADAIGRALRHDVAVVPLVRAADGSTQIRVVPADAGRLDLPLFSSASSLGLFIADDASREFDLQRGSALVGFLTAHRDRIGRVLFDPGGPHPVAAPVEAVIESLRPRPGDDDVGWIAGSDAAAAAPAAGGTPRGTVVDFRWAMPLLGWQRVVPADLRSQPSAVAGRISRIARRVPRPLRSAVADWLADTARADAPLDSLREVAYLSEGRGDEALIVLASRHWVAGASPGTDFDAVVAGIRSGLGPGDELAASGEELTSRSVRVTRTTVVPGLPDDAAVTVEYVLEAPGGQGLCRARFSSPGRGTRERLQRLSAPIIAGGEWVATAPR